MVNHGKSTIVCWLMLVKSGEIPSRIPTCLPQLAINRPSPGLGAVAVGLRQRPQVHHVDLVPEVISGSTLWPYGNPMQTQCMHSSPRGFFWLEK